MAKIYSNSKTGEVALASQFNGIRNLINQFGFQLLIPNYRSYYYGIYRKYNTDCNVYEFFIVSKVNEQKEKLLVNEGYELIKPAYSNQIKDKYLWQGFDKE